MVRCGEKCPGPREDTRCTLGCPPLSDLAGVSSRVDRGKLLAARDAHRVSSVSVGVPGGQAGAGRSQSGRCVLGSPLMSVRAWGRVGRCPGTFPSHPLGQEGVRRALYRLGPSHRSEPPFLNHTGFLLRLRRGRAVCVSTPCACAFSLERKGHVLNVQKEFSLNVHEAHFLGIFS